MTNNARKKVLAEDCALRSAQLQQASLRLCSLRAQTMCEGGIIAPRHQAGPAVSVAAPCAGGP